MPDTPSANFITEKNKQENTPIMLYEVTIDESTTLYLAEWDSTITYPTVGGHDYLPFPLKHEGISINALGEVDAVKVSMSSVDRSIVAQLTAQNGLRGHKVVMKLIFAAYLSDANAYVASEYYIDSVETTETEAVFILTGKVDLYQVKFPARIYERNHCQWEFKKEGCWLWSGGAWTAPAGFLHGDVDCDHTRNGSAGCKYHVNSSRFGAFPGIPARGIYVV